MSISVHSTQHWILYPPDVISYLSIQQLISKLSFTAVTILYYWGRTLEQAVDGKQLVLIQPSSGSNLHVSLSYIRWEFNDCWAKPYYHLESSTYYLWILCFVDLASWNMHQPDALFIFALYQLTVGGPGWPTDSQLRCTMHASTHTHTYIYSVTSWWWATSKPETCRGVVTQ
jgi:hypothetical protein